MKMSIWGRFIDWRKNIIKHNVYSVFFHFANGDNYALFDEILLFPKSILPKNEFEEFSKKKLRKEVSDWGKGETSVTYSYDGKSIENIYVENIFISKNSKSKHGNYIALVLTSKIKPELFIKYFLKKYSNYLMHVFFFNPSFSKWDNYTYANGLKYTKGLKFNPIPGVKQKAIDISNYPGRFTYCGSWHFRGASEYWFGQKMYNFISKEKLVLFKDCLINEELENEIVHIKLFEVNDHWTDEAQRKLRLFRDYLEVDKYETKPFG